MMESIDELKKRHPKEWARVFKKVEPLIRENKVDEMIRLMHENSGSKIKSKMFRAFFTVYSDAVLSRKLEGKIKLPRYEAWLLEAIFFEGGLKRKAASPIAFKMIWPFIRQKGTFLSLAASRGVYCFYSKPLLRGLKKIINSRPCIEIAAGDGVLTELLQEMGVKIEATDNHSWKEQIQFPSSVQNLSAEEALKKFEPEVVLSCWPPPGNLFEKKVFETESVQTYIVLGSRTPGATGNPQSYAEAKTFEWIDDKELAAKVYPPELLPHVYIFNRRASPSS